MKKIITLSLIMCVALMAFSQSTTPRFGTPPSGDNTGRTLTLSHSSPDTTSATLTLHPNASKTFISPAPLVKATTINVSTAGCHKYDELIFMFKGAGVANGGSAASYTVTFGTGLEPSSSTLVADSTQMANAYFVFNGTTWVEVARARE